MFELSIDDCHFIIENSSSESQSESGYESKEESMVFEIKQKMREENSHINAATFGAELEEEKSAWIDVRSLQLHSEEE